MSDSPLNGDTRPRGLRAALGIIGAHVKQSIKRRRAGYTRTPRQYCRICASVFDWAVIAPDAVAQSSVCSKCRKMLAKGYTACVAKEGYAFIRSPHLKDHNLSGKIIQLSDEAYAKIKKESERRKSTDEGEVH